MVISNLKKYRIILAFVAAAFFVFAFNTPANAEMISYWKLDEIDGNIVNDSVGNNHGTSEGAIWTVGIVNNGLRFDGQSRVVIPNHPSLNPTVITVETWVKLNRIAYGTGGSPLDAQVFLFKGGDRDLGGYNLAQSAYSNNPLEAQFQWFIPPFWDLNYIRTPPTALQTNRWYHIAGTYDGDTMKIYVDGVFQGSIIVGPLQVGNEFPLYLSYNGVPGWPYYLDGYLDEVAIHDSVLTPEEIMQHYQNGLNGLGYEIVVSEISCTGFNPPMDKTITVKKKNRVLPLKMVCYDGETELTDLDIVPPVVEVDYVNSNGDPSAVEEVLYAGQGDEGNQFVYSDGYWRFNLQTKNFSAYGTYAIKAVSGDASSYNIVIPYPEATFVIE